MDEQRSGDFCAISCHENLSVIQSFWLIDFGTVTEKQTFFHKLVLYMSHFLI